MVARPKMRMQRRKKVTTNKKKVVKKALAKANTALIKQVALSVLKRNVENKQTNLDLLTDFPVPGGGLQINQGNTSGVVKPSIVPTVQQGVAVNQRIGNKIKPQSLRIKGYVRSREYDAITNTNTRLFYAHIWIVIDKTVKSPFNMAGQPIYNTNPSNFKRNGNQPVPFDGSIMNSLYGYNTDTYTVLAHRRIKLDTLQPTTPVGATTPSYVIQDSINNGAVYAKPFSITLSKLPKQLLFDEDDTGASIGEATNFNPLMYVALQNMDGSLSSYTQQRFAITAQSTLYFEDA